MIPLPKKGGKNKEKNPEPFCNVLDGRLWLERDLRAKLCSFSSENVYYRRDVSACDGSHSLLSGCQSLVTAILVFSCPQIDQMGSSGMRVMCSGKTMQEISCHLLLKAKETPVLLPKAFFVVPYYLYNPLLGWKEQFWSSHYSPFTTPTHPLLALAADSTKTPVCVGFFPEHSKPHYFSMFHLHASELVRTSVMRYVGLIFCASLIFFY